jgi:DNA-binding NtrC family response regulator
MVALRAEVAQLAPTDLSVLVVGQTGTGKENVARALHDGSARGGRPLVAINCGAIPAHLAESELFGAEAGAYTGATRRRLGRIEAADGGTLFLDEIGELPLSLQAQLLRVLETGEVQRLGATCPVPVDVRLVAATNRNLEEMVARGQFRADLYWRLAAAVVVVPPLAARLSDIPALVAHFAGDAVALTGDGLARLLAHDWPGNVRELRNLVDRALGLGETRLDGPAVSRLLRPARHSFDAWLADRPVALPPRLSDFAGENPYGPGNGPLPEVPLRAVAELPPLVLKALLREAEAAIIRQALEAGGGNVAGSARMLGMKRTTLVEKMRRMGLAAAPPAGSA